MIIFRWSLPSLSGCSPVVRVGSERPGRRRQRLVILRCAWLMLGPWRMTRSCVVQWLPVSAVKLCPYRYTALESRYRYEGSRGLRRDRLEEALLVHFDTVGAFAPGRVLVTTTSYLQTCQRPVSQDFVSLMRNYIGLPFFFCSTCML
jgi:hypothetical protein